MDNPSASLHLPRTAQHDNSQPTVYVVTIHNNPSTTTQRVHITTATPDYGPQAIPSSPPGTMPAATQPHPAFCNSEARTTATTLPGADGPTDRGDWAAAKPFVPRQDNSSQDAPPANPVIQTMPSSLSTLTQLLEEIRRTQICTHCRSTRQTNSVRVQRPSCRSNLTPCYYHRQFGQMAMKCKTPYAYGVTLSPDQ